MPRSANLIQFGRDHGWLLLVLPVVLMIGIPLLGAAIWMEQQTGAEERARYGNTIARQLADSALDAVLEDDRIALSLLVRETAEHPAVAASALYSADETLIVSADRSRRSPRSLDPDSPDAFVKPLRLDGSIAGFSRVTLGPRPNPLWPELALLLAALSALLGLLGWYASRWLDARLAPVRAVFEDHAEATAKARHSLGALLELTAPAPTDAATSEAPARKSQAETDPEFAIIINLFNQLSLPPAARRAAIDACVAALQPLCQRYRAELVRLRQSGLALHPPRSSDSAEDGAAQAVELALRAQDLLETCNQARIDEGEAAMTLRLGVDALPEPDAATEPGQRLSRAITLSALARDQGIAVTDEVMYRCRHPEQFQQVPLQSAALKALGESRQAWLVHRSGAED